MRPPAPVLEAFGVAGEPELLPEGFTRTAWRVGDVVVKRVGHVVEHAWISEVYDAWSAPDVRVPTPLRAADGAWSCEGWGAHVWLPGETVGAAADPDWFRAAGEAFHVAVRELDAPAHLATKQDHWTTGDRVAWDDAPPGGDPATLELLHDALALRRPVDLPIQLVHGDLGHNVLRHDGLPPGVIDWPPYVRPVGWALAVSLLDEVCYWGSPPALLDRWADLACWDQLLLRALIYRVATRGAQEVEGDRQAAPYVHDDEVRTLALLRERL